MYSTLFFLTRLVDALGQPVDDRVAALRDGRVVEADVPSSRNAELLRRAATRS